ncbi:hypothetical protein G210_5642 [Candida maltosa Xu316]|uniref:Uncharacterized protein n=1 Tax=Candida maltosa (strain Xu316) TaxID=1245528 RepID=M3HQ06_CANMX|nr:hypothetical protein G210_5642 [Candida maltosa Xu316]
MLSRQTSKVILKRKSSIPIYYNAAKVVGCSWKLKIIQLNHKRSPCHFEIRPLTTSSIKGKQFNSEVENKLSFVNEEYYEAGSSFSGNRREVEHFQKSSNWTRKTVEEAKLERVLFEVFLKHECNTAIDIPSTVYDSTRLFYPELKEFPNFLNGLPQSAKTDKKQITRLKEKYLRKVQTEIGKLVNTSVLGNLHNPDFLIKDNFVPLSDALINDEVFCQLFVEEVIPAIEKLDKLVKYFNNNLDLFKPELCMLDNQYNFKKISMDRLIGEIDKTSQNLELFVTSKNPIDEDFFKKIIQCPRYRALKEILQQDRTLSLKDIRKIIRNPHYEDYTKAIAEHYPVFNRYQTEEYINSLEGAGKLYHYLTTMKKVPLIDDFYKLAPMLHKLAHDKNEVYYNKSAATLLRLLTDMEVIRPVQPSHCIQDQHKFAILDVSDIPLYNYIFSYLVSKQVPIEYRKLENFIEPIVYLPELSRFDLILEEDFQDIFTELFLDPDIAIKYFQSTNESMMGYMNIGLLDTPLETLAKLCYFRCVLGRTYGTFDTAHALVDTAKKFDPALAEEIYYMSSYFGDHTYLLDYFIDGKILHHSLREPSTLDTYKEISKYLEFLKELSKESSSLRLIKYFGLDNFKPELELLKLSMRDSFANHAARTIIRFFSAAFSDSDKFDIARICKLGTILEASLFNLDTKILDDVVNESHSIEYKQIPNDFFLEEYVNELESLKDFFGIDRFDKISASNILGKVKELSEDSARNVEQRVIWGKLYTNLVKLFDHNNNSTFALDTVISSAKEFAKLESKLAGQNKEYRQIPDNFNLEEFLPELYRLRNALDVDQFANVSSQQILDKSKELSECASIVDVDESFVWKRLHHKLDMLFKHNNNSTFALDTLVSSVEEFNKFEESLTTKKVKENVEYKQVPDDFNFEEYFIELSELKKELNVSSFADTTASSILNKISELREDSTNGVEKSIIWARLYRNLSQLFKINDDSTFILDNVINSAHEYLKLQSNISATKIPESVVGLQAQFLRGSEYEVLGNFLRNSELLYRPDVHKISRNQFDEIVDAYEASLNKSDPTYLFTKNVLENFKKYNSEIDFYPPFLVCIYGANYFEDQAMSPYQLEAFYDDLVRSLYDIEAQEDNIVDHNPITTKFDMDEFKKEVKPQPESKRKGTINYHNTEKYLSDLDKKNSTADFDVIRSAVHSAFEEPEPERIISTREELGSHKKAFKPVKTLDPAPPAPPPPLSVEEQEFDSLQLQKYLQKAKRDEESKIREKEAYEWSKMAELDSKQANITSNISILTLDGDFIPVTKESLGDLPEEDIFKALSKFNKDELVKASRLVKELQAKNWKVIGSKVEGDKKYLVLSRNPTDGKKVKWSKIIFGTSGLAVLTLFGASLMVDETEQFNKAISEYEKKEEIVNNNNNNITGPFSVTSGGASVPIFGKEKPTSIISTEEEQQESKGEELPWWKSLLWTK